MSAQQADTSDAAEVTCVLVPLHEHTLLIPNACVAEVLPWRRSKQLAGVPPWCIGVLGWRGESVVVVDYEVVVGGQPASSPHRAMVVLKKTGSWEGSAFYAVAAAGLPRLVHVGEQELGAADDGDAHAAVAMRVAVGTEEALIADFGYLEEQVRQIL
jgi:chemosensory pili system protein ChpC